MAKIISFQEAAGLLRQPAVRDLRLRALRGDGEAAFNYALWLGIDTPPGEQWLRLSAEKGYEPAQSELAMLCHESPLHDAGEAARWYLASARQGNASSMFNLGVIHAEGMGVPRNLKVAASWYRKAAAAGHPVAMSNLGIMHYYGHGVRKSSRVAAHWYERAGGAGHPEALFNLGVLYYRGVEPSCDDGAVVPFNDCLRRDRARAFNLYQEAAEAGLAQAQFALGYMLCKGEGCRRDLDQGRYWLACAAKQGNDSARQLLQALAANRPRRDRQQ